MIDRYTELAQFKARDNRIPGLDDGDLMAVALEAILKAVRSYKDERIPFEKYARFLIGQGMVSASRRQKRVPLEFASYEPEELIDLDEVLECDQSATPFRGLMLRSDLSRLAELLDEHEKQVLFLKLQEYTDLEIAEHLACSRITVWRRMQRIRKKAENLSLCNN